MTEQKILIIEDEKKIAALLSDYLKMEGFNVSMLFNGDKAVSNVRNNPPDLIILDLMLPGKDGLTICKEIRSFSKVPILIISAKVDEVDRLLGLELGADDYICKPFSPKEVVARVKAVFRRFEQETEEMLVAGPITIFTKDFYATADGKRIRLSRSELALLISMVSHPGQLFTRNDLFSILQGHDSECSKRTIDSHIKNLRKKMDEISPGRELIRTVYGLGYTLDTLDQDDGQSPIR
jgi:two-component system, OmpR family, response regulator BaeR